MTTKRDMRLFQNKTPIFGFVLGLFSINFQQLEISTSCICNNPENNRLRNQGPLN